MAVIGYKGSFHFGRTLANFRWDQASNCLLLDKILLWGYITMSGQPGEGTWEVFPAFCLLSILYSQRDVLKWVSREWSSFFLCSDWAAL